ncbi:radical SAM protein, partial [bacterium]|nr:radical SAM protein [bacterium]
MSDKYIMDGHKLFWHLDRVSAWEKGERIAPLHIDVGLSKGCNLKCIYCFGELQGNKYMKGKDVYFPREPLLKYMREAGEAGVRSLAIIGEAEPLMNPHVYDAIAEGKKGGADISLGTNGVLLDTGSQGEEALENLTWIRFNISAATDEAYRKVHRSRDFETLMEKIRFCVAQKRKKQLDITIGMQMVLVPANVDQVLALADLGKTLGVDYLVIKQCSDTKDSDLGVYDRLGEYDSFEAILKEAESKSVGEYNVIVKWDKVTNKGERSYAHCLGAPFLLY